MDKHSSLLQKFVNYGEKKFYNIGPWAQCYKTFLSINLQIFVIRQSVCISQTFNPRLLFMGKARSLPQSGVPERFFNTVGSCFTIKHKTRLERLARDKDSSLLQKYVDYSCKTFYSTSSSYQVNPLAQRFLVRNNFSDALNSTLSTDKHSSLFRTLLNYGQKSLITLAPELNLGPRQEVDHPVLQVLPKIQQTLNTCNLRFSGRAPASSTQGRGFDSASGEIKRWRVSKQNLLIGIVFSNSLIVKLFITSVRNSGTCQGQSLQLVGLIRKSL